LFASRQSPEISDLGVDRRNVQEVDACWHFLTLLIEVAQFGFCFMVGDHGSGDRRSSFVWFGVVQLFLGHDQLVKILSKYAALSEPFGRVGGSAGVSGYLFGCAPDCYILRCFRV
jgi:hypothetical protein